MAFPSFSPLQIEQKTNLSPIPPSSTSLSIHSAFLMPTDQYSQTDSLLLLHQHIQKLNTNLSQINLRQYQTLLLSADALLRQKEAKSKQLQLQNLALQQKLRSIILQNQQLCSMARRSEAVASALRVSLQNVIIQNEAAAREREGFGDSGEVGEEESCCERKEEIEVSRFKCRVCREREVSILLIPCNHLCVCGDCEELVTECPSCRLTKRGALKVFL
ncbi:hypothetical protein IEQ34_009448 [Dendrobium chrysotoxum]|uniref:RING-type domain-containing protein n=1 Tax=Dendrobium chrysotoxum TaxID=161865 RepID=A0AAV7H2W6_DENCH|nr:hypothetical protein IEQ34_009448 [Dendrobium chrysotoxum]